MNFTIGATQINAWKRFKLHYVVAVAGLALAAGAVVGLSERDSASSPATVSPAQPAAERTLPKITPPSQLLVYIVGSETAKLALERDVKNTPEWFGGDAADTAVRVIVVEPGVEDSLATVDQLLPEALITTGNGPGLKFLDMR